MEKMWIRLILALAMGMSVSACGKKKESSSVGDGNLAKTETKKTTGDGKDVALPEGSNDKKGKDASGALPDGAQIKGDQKKNSDKNGQGNQVKPDNGASKGGQVPLQPGTQNPGTQVPPKVSSTNEISREEVAEMLAEANRYAPASADGLREYLAHKQNQVADEQQRAKNLKLAYEIKKATYRFDYLTGRFRIEITLNKEAKTIGLIGDIRDQASGLASNEAGVQATATCLDQSGGKHSSCETAVIDLNYKGSNAKVILRKSAVAIRGDFPNRNCLTKACEDVYGLLRNTELKMKEANTIRTAEMDTFEVVQGRSGFRLFVTTHENEVIKIAGPLANQMEYPVLDTPTDRTLSADELKDARTGHIYKTVIHNSLYDVSIVGNEYGNVKLLVKMRVQKNGDRDHFVLNLERRIQPIRMLID